MDEFVQSQLILAVSVLIPLILACVSNENLSFVNNIGLCDGMVVIMPHHLVLPTDPAIDKT